MKRSTPPSLARAIEASRHLSAHFRAVAAANGPHATQMVRSKVASITTAAWAARRRRIHHE